MIAREPVRDPLSAAVAGAGSATAEVKGEEPRPGLRPRRIQGLDVARGFALIGMIIVHTMPSRDPDTGGVSVLHQIFSGHAAALFALLAGVSLALLTGGAAPHAGCRLRRDRVVVATRAMVLLVFGMALNFIPPQVFSILPFYGVYFLVGTLFVGSRVRTLCVWAGAFALFGPFVAHAIGRSEVFESISAPTLMTVVMEPLDVVVSLFAIGYYPALTWMAYLLLGMALGRMDLARRCFQAAMVVWGAVVAGAAMLVSPMLMHWFGVYGRLVADSGSPEAEIREVLAFGGPVPVDSWWWLAADAAHANTPLSVISSAAIAVAVLGVFLLLGSVAERPLALLAAPGSMTFTLYSVHLVLVASGIVYAQPMLWMLLQIGVAVVFGLVWRALFGQGPLERIMSRTATAVGRVVVPERGGTGDGFLEGRRPDVGTTSAAGPAAGAPARSDRPQVEL